MTTDFSLKVVTGEDVFPLLANPAFFASWTDLGKKDAKFTAVQEPSYVEPWYSQYRDTFIPALFLAYNNAGELIGVLPLATSSDNGSVVHAGAWQAEYRGWISSPHIDEAFPIACLIEVKRRFNPRIWEWGWLPPGAPLSWLQSQALARHGIHVKYVVQQSPVWDLANEQLTKHKYKSLRNYRNRYRKRGDFYLQRITTIDATKRLMPILRNQRDFRSLALYGVRPFTRDPHKLNFFVERQRYPHAHHFTVLWSNDKPVAFHFGVCDDQRMYLGLECIDPSESRYSPGSLLLIELAKMLAEEGRRYLDLTPGKEEYKERFANAYQTLCRPTFVFSRSRKLYFDVHEKTRSAGKSLLAAVGVRQRQRSWLRARSRAIRGCTKKALLSLLAGRIRRSLYENKLWLIYRLAFDERLLLVEDDPEINTQQWEDLLKHSGSESTRSEQQIFAEALSRFTLGDVLYSMTCNGILAHCGWRGSGGKRQRFQGGSLFFECPPASAWLGGFYTEPRFRGEGLCLRNLRQMVSDGLRSGAEEIYAVCEYDDMPLRCDLQAVGFDVFRTLGSGRVVKRELKA